MNYNELTIFFIAQPGGLSLKSRLLAASLRMFGPKDLKLVACVPAHLNNLDDLTVKTFDSLRVEIVEFEARIWKRYDYPIGNKLDAAALNFSTRYAMFLDSDMFAVRKLEFWRLPQCSLSARPIMATQAFTEENASVFREFVNLNCKVGDIPLGKYDDTGFPSQVGFPIYNSGLVIFETSRGYQRRWWELASAVLEFKQFPERLKYPFADQTSLAVAALEAGTSFKILKNKWNMNINTAGKDPYIYHYFGFMRLLRDQRAYQLVKKLQRETKKRGLPVLGEISEKDLLFLG